MNRLPVLLCVLLFPILAACQSQSDSASSAALSAPQNLLGVENFVVYKTRAFAVGAPILVSGPTVQRASWSPDGQFMVIEQMKTDTSVGTVQSAILDDTPVRPESSLSVYSLSNGKVSDVFRFDTAPYEDDIQWIPGSDKALVVVTKDSTSEDAPWRTAKLYILDAATASIKEFTPWGAMEGDPEAIDVMASPTQSYAFVSASFHQPDKRPMATVHGDATSKLILMTADELYVPVNVPDGFGRTMPIWSQDGATAYVLATAPSKDSTPKSAWFTVSLTNGSLTKSSKPSSFYMGGEPGGLITVRDIDQNSTNQKVTKAIHTLWLETLDPDSQNRMLLAGDATNGAVNKTLEAASYLSQGSLYIRPITEVPRSRFDQELAIWKRSQIMNKAKQAGLAFLMFASDNDDTFPSIKDKWETMLEPYVKDSSDLDGFVYSYPGGPVTDIRSPWSTQLGYMEGSDGRAVVFIDGHVKWVPKS